jgi:predicted nuclease of predicted toxin-antitoxin system
MKFIIDAQLPASLADFFPGHDVIHTTKLKFGNLTEDETINELSVNEQRIVITKDDDFYHSYITRNRPYKLILVKLGNFRIAELKEYFKTNSAKILELISVHSFLILDKRKIKVLE